MQEGDVSNAGYDCNEDDDLFVLYVKLGKSRSMKDAPITANIKCDPERSQKYAARMAGTHYFPVQAQSASDHRGTDADSSRYPARDQEMYLSQGQGQVLQPLQQRSLWGSTTHVTPRQQPFRQQIQQGRWDDLNNNVQYQPHSNHGYQDDMWRTRSGATPYLTNNVTNRAAIPYYVRSDVIDDTGRALQSAQRRDGHGAGRYRYHSQLPGLPLPGGTVLASGDRYMGIQGQHQRYQQRYPQRYGTQSCTPCPGGSNIHESRGMTSISAPVIVIEPIPDFEEITDSEPIPESRQTSSNDLISTDDVTVSPASSVKSNIHKSISVQTEGGGFSCRFCGETFSRKPLLAIHEVLHTVKCKNEPSPTSVKVKCKSEPSLTSVKDNSSVPVTRSQKRTADCDLLPPGKRFLGNTIGELLYDIDGCHSNKMKTRLPTHNERSPRLKIKLVKDKTKNLYSVHFP